MKLLIAKSAGFCMGVRRAVELVLDAANKTEGPIYTYGPLIHNPQTIRLLEEKGITVLDEIPEKGSGIILIRTHGIPPQAKKDLETAGFTVINATCPRVIRVQAIIKKHARKGFSTIIIGDNNHPEVIGLLGHADGKGSVIDNLQALDSLPPFDNAIIVAQTTQNTLFFDEVEQWAARKHPHYKVFNTICDSTERRQSEVARLAKSVDAVIVAGGHNSGNTKRLAEIARRQGKQVFHVETESELDMEALSSARRIGITAGASTPNWIIKKVYRTLEAMLSEKEQRWRKALYSTQRALLLTNIYVSIGAGCLCYTAIKLLGINYYFPYVLISMLYVLSMHILNNLTGRKADRYNDPERALFYEENKPILAFFAVVAGGAGLFTAYMLGKTPFLTLLIMSLLGLSYNLRIIPAFLSLGGYRRIRDIPGSKTILIALAWGIVTSALPSLSISPQLKIDVIIVFILSTSMVFVRTAFFDVLDMQGDRIVGRGTIPLLLGEKRTIHLLKFLLIITLFILLLSSILNIISSLGYALMLCPILIMIVLNIHEQGHMLPGTRLEFLIESHFVLAGIITMIWSVVIGRT